MPDRKVRIEFDTTANTKGAEDAGQAIEDVVNQAGQLEKSAGNATGAVQNLSNAMDERGPRGPGLKKGMQDAGRAGRGLAAVIGGPLSRVMSILSAGPAAALTAVVGLAVQQFMRFRRELEERVQRSVEMASAALERFAQRMGDIADRKHREELERFRESIRDLSKDLENEQRRMTASNTLLDARLSVQQRIAELQRQERELALRDLPDEEQLTEQARIDMERARDQAEAEIETARRNLEAAQLAEKQAKEDAIAKAANLSDAEALAEQADERARDLERRLNEAQASSGHERQKVLRDRERDLRREIARTTAQSGMAGGGQAAVRAAAQAQRLRHELDRIREEIAEAERAADRVPVIQEELTSALKNQAKAQAELTAAKTAEEDAARTLQKATEDAATTMEETQVLMDGLREIIRLQVGVRQKQLDIDRDELRAAQEAQAAKGAEDDDEAAEQAARKRDRQAQQIARTAGSVVPGGMPNETRKDLERVQAMLADGIDAGEIELLQDVLATMRRFADEKSADRIIIDQLKGQIRNL